MKKSALLLLLCLLPLFNSAQESYTIDGETLELKTEVDGTIDLLWTVENGQYRYFVRKDMGLTELKNTRDSNNDFQEEYKKVLSDLTNNTIPTDKLRLTLYDLRSFCDSYNATVDPSYSPKKKDAKLNSRLLFFGGITNSPFVENPDNVSNPVFGAEIEFSESNSMPRHSLFFQIKHVLSNDDFAFSTTQLGLGYRFRVINKQAFNIYASVLGATYNSSKNEFEVADMVISEKGDSFDAPFIFGVGADIRVSDKSFVTITYDELFAIFFDNQGNFSKNIAVGYKLKL